jgi:hypothetical protein
MDYTKFIAMLEDNALFFSRGDRFRDRFEGSVPKKLAEELRILWIEQQRDSQSPLDEKQAKQRYDKLAQLDRKLVAINCWYMDDSESDAMWQLYLKGAGEGVAIRSTVGRLIAALEGERRDVHIGIVDYIDYESDEFESRSRFSQFLHKRLGFKHENELRAMVGLNTKMQSGERFDYINSNPEVEHGLNVSVNLQALIEQVVIAPGAKWLELVTLKVINRHGLPVHVRCTQLDADPTY